LSAGGIPLDSQETDSINQQQAQIMEANPPVYYRTWGHDNVAYGPLELPAMVTWIRQGRVTPKTWVYREDKNEWARAGELVELKPLFKSGAAGTQAAAAGTQGITPGALRRIKIFADMEERQLASFLQYMEVLKLLPNAAVCVKGDRGDAMFLVLEGEVRARVMVSGKESTLATMTVGECFGELAVIDESPRSADVVTNRETVLLKISAGNLKRLFQEAPALAAPFLFGLNRTIASRVRSLTKRYEDSISFARSANEK
jgi:CRP/FNR family cyclic AMP-dependent transcriptional regulator